ncbi:MAG: Na/Pi cotransporter family protein [Bacteroidales bacterium]|nr:Na/Pi cotransporter family protein [Bacteroidales bacterium]
MIDVAVNGCETATATFANVNIFLIFGGLGLFLYGMKMMMDGLELMAGNRMRIYIEKATANRFAAVGIGALVTILIQSSTATSVMAVGFINAGLMSLAQAISLILGAHIGTTLTAHLFAFPGITTVAPLLIFFGLIAYLFFRKQTTKDVGFILLGIGILFFGLSVMGEPLRELAGTYRFQSILSAFENPFLAVLAGFIFTAIIQSSTAATGILITLLLKGDVDISFTVAAFLVLGISAGTTITALIASLAGRRESKRAALANLIYISIGCLVFGTLISVFPGILRWFENTWTNEALQLAWFYTFFKVVLTFTFLPFVGYLASLMYVIMPKRNRDVDSKELLFIKTEAPKSPSEAIEQATAELNNMGELTLENLKRSLEAFSTGDSKTINTVVEVNSSINYLQRQITSMLMELQDVKSAADMKKLSTLLYVAADFERIANNAKNFVQYNTRTNEGNLRLPPAAMEEISTLGDAVVEIVTLTLEVFSTHSQELILQIYELEDKIDDMVQVYLENHVKRSKTEKSDPRGGVAFLGIINDLERCADRAYHLASYYKR